uniref:Uncharacterized protein n=1 Tax=Bos indicus x Bos taurus TaxID=30522 RepID=A0A4W2HUQ1_BOBOX
MAVTFQMLAVQQSTSHAIHSWHSRRPSCQRRPDSSCTRLSGMTRAATSTSEMAMDAIRLCGTRWNVRTRRMVASTSRFQANVAATRKPSKVIEAEHPRVPEWTGAFGESLSVIGRIPQKLESLGLQWPRTGLPGT